MPLLLLNKRERATVMKMIFCAEINKDNNAVCDSNGNILLHSFSEQ